MTRFANYCQCFHPIQFEQGHCFRCGLDCWDRLVAPSTHRIAVALVVRGIINPYGKRHEPAGHSRTRSPRRPRRPRCEPARRPRVPAGLADRLSTPGIFS